MLPWKQRKRHILPVDQNLNFISIFYTCQVSACELQPFSCIDLGNDIYSQTAKTVFSHLTKKVFATECVKAKQERITIELFILS